MSNSVFQSVIVQLKDVSDRVFGVIDTDGCVVSCTDVSLLGERWNDAALKLSTAYWKQARAKERMLESLL